MILGSLMNKSSHGYKLKSIHTSKLQKDFGINDGQLYPALKKMESEGLIEKEVIHQDGSPNRHNYSITDKGRKEFMEWLAGNDGEEHAFRYDFIRKDPFFTRATFINFLDRETAVKKVEWQIAAERKAIEDLKAARQGMLDLGLEGWKVKILEFGIRKEEARLEWLEEFLEENTEFLGWFTGCPITTAFGAYPDLVWHRFPSAMAIYSKYRKLSNSYRLLGRRF